MKIFGNYASNTLTFINPKEVLKPLNNPEMMEMKLDSTHPYLTDCLLQKLKKKDEWSMLNSILIAIENVFIPTVHPHLKNFSAYGLTDDGSVYVEYYGDTAKHFNEKVNDTMDNDIGKTEKTVVFMSAAKVLASRIGKYGEINPYKIQTTSTKHTDEHSPRALLSTILVYFLLNPEAKKTTYGKSISHHFNDAITEYKLSGNYRLPLFALVNDLYALVATDIIDIEKAYGEKLPFDTSMFINGFEQLIPGNDMNLSTIIGTPSLTDGISTVKTKVKSTAKKIGRTVNDLIKSKEYEIKCDWNEIQQAMIPNDCENVVISNEAERTLKAIKSTWDKPMKFWNLCWYGPSGTGKSTDARALAQIMGFPYYPMALSDATYADDLLIIKTANTSQMSKTDFLDMIARYPSVVEASKDVETAWNKLTGQKKAGVTIEEYESLLNEKIFSLCENTKPFKEVTSPLFDAYVNGGLCELVEANAMKPAQAKILNSMLDDTAQIVVDGKVYKRNPNFICISTFNCDAGTEGVHAMSRDFVQRYQYGEYFDAISDDEIKKRIMRKTSLKNDEIIDKVIKVYHAMQNVCEEKGDTHDFVGLRQLYSWCQLIDITGKPYESGLGCMVRLGTFDNDFAEELKEALKTQFDEYSDIDTI